MANFFLASVLFRIALPLLILTCALFRPCLLSAIYLFLLLYSSLVPVPTEKSMAGPTGIYFKILMAFSILGFILQLAFQIVLFAIPPYGHFLVHCEMLEMVLSYCGFVRLDDANGIVMTTWLSPEIVMVLSSLVIYLFCKKLTSSSLDEEANENPPELPQKTKSKRNFGFWISLGKYTCVISLCVTAVLRPSAVGAFYFLVFIGSCTWWACCKELERAFGIVCRIVMAFVFLHIVCLYAYQFEWIRQKVDNEVPYSGLLGIEQLFNVSCSDPRDIQWTQIHWDAYLHPLALIWLFYIMAIVSKHLLKPKEYHHSHTSSVVSEHTPLMRGVSPSRRYGSGTRKGHLSVLQDSTGSVTVTSENPDDIPLRELEEEDGADCFENAVFIVESIITFIIQSSYVVTNIIMMTWSITYHSWLTFVLLLWAMILWMIPNQRRSTLRCSPFLVFYAIFLLLSAYVYCMDIPDLPDHIYGISLEQIGINKIEDYPCNSLMIKSLFTLMFWITLRQHVKEIKEARQANTLAEMAAPLQVTVTTTTGITREQEQETQILKTIGEHTKKFLSRMWIWIVAITLFAVAITGDRMTAFRIMYMALFLFFIITFQLSFRIWLKVMFAFWLTVIIYSMIILILVYTYQFDSFDDYWTKYLHVPKEQQLDIGLERYGPTQLFVRLATPTFFVIVTVIQLHYFHDDFIKLSRAAEQPIVAPTSEEGSSLQGKVLEQRDDDTDKSNLSSLKIDLTDLGNVSSIHIKYKLNAMAAKMGKLVNFAFLFLEIYMHKFVLLIAMLMCIYDSCALYYAVLFFVVIAVTTSTRTMQLFVIYSSSIFVSFILLTRMVYQIQYIKHDTWNVSCNISENVSLNNADWLGFRKTVRGRHLPYLVRWNIAYILAVTLYTVVIIRQFNHKLLRHKPTTRWFFMFPGINRAEADKNLCNCLKYLANYGYYKFGVEISLMATVALIGFRMDLYAILYSVWLCILFPMKRGLLSKIWNVYLIFIAVFIPIQYVMVVGLPPILCLDFKWDEGGPNSTLRPLQEWAFLMDYLYPPAAKKLVFDCILLLFVSRQAVVFRIERRYKNRDYPGGSNDSIIHFAEHKDFVNPSPDFITYTRSYLDVVKRVVLLGFMWLTLAIVFLAGANRVNMFSIGYLLGSFIFLWQGSDIYLRPIPKILKSWNCLLGYNILVILTKTILQLVGCVFLGDISECWLVQLLGIGCVRKFTAIPKNLPGDMCEVPRDYIGLVWDGICFGFLIMQRRIFCSYNFFHMIDETKATTILASRGAELIEQLRQKRMHEQDEQERRILEKIKAKMDRIKATQKKMQGPFQSTTNHYVDEIYPKSSRPLYKRRQPKTYKEAIRSGDYYMFDELEDDDDLDMIEELKPEEDEESDEEKRGGGRRRTLAELLSTAIRTDIGTTIRTTKDGTSSRRASMPLARQKSTMSTRSQISAPLSAPPIIEESPERRRTPSAQKKRARLADIEPQPSTSKDEDMSEYSEPKASKCQAFMDVVLFVWAFLDSLMVSLINFLNSYSRDYRYVVKVLKKERKLLKQTSEYTQGIRTGRSQMWQPAGSYHSLLHRSQAIEQARDNSADNSNNTATAVSGDSDEKQPPSECSEGKGPTSPLPYSPEKDRRKASVLTVPEIRILAPSMERGLDSPSLLPCSSDVLTTIHPKFEEYDTGELSSYDQPTVIRFGLALWYIVVSHSDILCYFVLFLNQIKSATFLSLPLPLMVFLWGTLTVPRPSKNFWITIIAYTQMIVLIKCLFQFEFLPWNRDMYYNYNPMNPAKIFGVERKSNYAIWDLLLLLIVFFHRYLLKCLGLWKTTVMVTPIFKDGEYMVDEEDIQPLKRAGMGAARLGLLEYEATKETVREPKFYVRKGQASMLLPKKKKVHLSPNPIESDENVRKRHVPKDKKEDLQRLVEENEDTPEEEDAETYSGIDNVVSVNVKQTTPYEMFPDTLQMSTSKYMEAIKDFFIQLRDPTSRVAVDVYSYMFLCDFFNFFVILIGFSSFGTQQGDGGVSSYLEDNRVPTLFLLMLILQFTLIIVDRAIFLRKNILAKIVFQFVQIIVLHVWLFVLFPVMTERRFNSVIPPQMYYMVKCFYLLLSAYQIRCGYPSRILGNFLCKGYNYFNMFLFKGFMVIPFLFELRSVMDWVWTDTSMTIFDWIKMEDIFAHIFQLKEFQPPEFLQKITGKQSDKKKCTRHVESEFPQPRGERKTPAAKYFMGGLILFIIVAIIWFPLVFFSLGNAVGEPNPPYDVSLEVRIGPYEPVYHISAQSNAIDQFSKGDLTELITTYKNNKGASAFIARYEAPDIVAIRLSADSANIWGVSPPDRRRMINEINSTNPISIRLLYVVSHHSNNKDVGGVIREENVIIMEAQVNGQPNNERQKLLEMLTDNTSVPAINLGYILPKFLKVTNRGTARPVPQMMNIIDNDPRTEELRQLTLLLRKSTKNTEIEWWEVNENCSDANYMELLKALPYHDCDSIVIYAFNDRLFPETLSFITAGGIIGLYTTLVFVASRVLRGFFSEICFKIMFDDMPNVDRVLQLCLDIYLVREAREFWLEEDLFAKLVFLFRSPETLIKWTRPKEELADDEDPEGEPE